MDFDMNRAGHWWVKIACSLHTLERAALFSRHDLRAHIWQLRKYYLSQCILEYKSLQVTTLSYNM